MGSDRRLEMAVLGARVNTERIMAGSIYCGTGRGRGREGGLARVARLVWVSRKGMENITHEDDRSDPDSDVRHPPEVLSRR